MKIFLIAVVGICIIGAGYWLFNNQVLAPDHAAYTSDVTTFTTADSPMTVQYDETGDKMKLTVDGTEYELERSVSASGAKYSNADESVVFWEHQGEATIEINGTSVTALSTGGAEILTFEIEPYMKDCIGESLMRCLVVNGELFYSPIEGFEFEEGTAYEITVARTVREDVPADASSYLYRRVEVLKSNKQGDPSANKYDFANDGVDNDCDDPHGNGVCDALDDDSDNDSIPTEDVSSANDGGSIVIEEGATLAANLPTAITAGKWLWTETQYSSGEVVTPEDSTQFEATFSTEGQFSSQTDCNSVGGGYTVDGTLITFGPMATTLMACAGETKETVYGEMLANVSSYTVAADGNLVLLLKFDSGAMLFTPK